MGQLQGQGQRGGGVTRAHALRQLLAHGALSPLEIITITGWPARDARRTIGYLAEWGFIHRVQRKWTL